MRAYDACEHLVRRIGPRWIGSEGEKRAGGWIERELSVLGYETRRLWFDCPAWDYGGTPLPVDGRRIDSVAQMFSPACDVQAELVRIRPDGKGGFTGEAAGTLGAVAASTLPETWSTKMFRDPGADFPTTGVSAREGERLLARTSSHARLTIDARCPIGFTHPSMREE